MQNFELSAYCHFFQLSAEHFYKLRGVSRTDLFSYVSFQKKKTLLELHDADEVFKKHLDTLDSDFILYPGHPDYPEEWNSIHYPPVFVMYEGPLALLRAPRISVIGTRHPDSRFLEWMDTQLQIFVEKHRLVVVSGGAVGVDQKASQVAHRSRQGTLLLLPSGLSHIYPRGLRESLRHGDCLYMSEYFPQERMQKSHFIRRNRLISSLGIFLLAVQFEIKSGSMITVKYALEQGKDVVVVPDHPTCIRSSGNLMLMRDGALMASGHEDLSAVLAGLRLSTPSPDGNKEENKVGQPEQ